jgi:hypothetical protein
MWIYLHTLTVTEFGSLFSVLLPHWSIDVAIAMFGLAGEPVRVGLSSMCDDFGN